MQYPPQGPHAPYGHGYGGPPRYPGHPGGGPPRQGSNVVVIVVAVIAAVLVVGGASCLLLVGLGAGAAIAADEQGTPAIAPAAGTNGEPSSGELDRTPVAQKLEEALRANKVPVQQVLCPKAPPPQGTFACSLETTQGDRAEIAVTVGPNGLAYDVPNVAFLDGAKLEGTFRGIVAAINPRLRAPCLTGTLMKQVGVDFTCPVFDGATSAGELTVSVIDKSGQVKMSYEGPASPGSAPSTRGGDTSSVDGRYECFQMRVVAGPNFTFDTQWVPGALPGFTITRGSYSSSGGGGRVDVSSSVVAFTGGGYGGWRGTTSTNSTGFFILFRGGDHSSVQPGGAKSGDYQCYRQRG